MESVEREGRLVVHLPTVLDLPAAGDLRDTLLDALARDNAAEIVLDAGAVERVSTAAIQVMLAAARGFTASARRLEIPSPSQAMTDAFKFLGLGAELSSLS